jgi:hypothetical protein
MLVSAEQGKVPAPPGLVGSPHPGMGCIGLKNDDSVLSGRRHI